MWGALHELEQGPWCLSFSLYHDPGSSWGTFLNFRPPENKIWNKGPKPPYFLHHRIYLHKKSSAVAAFFRKQFSQPTWSRIFHLLCWLTFPLLRSMKMCSYNASHLTFLSPSHFKTGPIKDIPMTLTHLDLIPIHVKNVLRLHISACWPDVYHQFTWQLEFLSLGLHCTHLHFSLAFQTSLDFCQPWHFSVTMYFSDSLIEGKWSLALFNSDIASGPQTDVCHCSFYFRGSGMHKAWEMALSSSSA